MTWSRFMKSASYWLEESHFLNIATGATERKNQSIHFSQIWYLTDVCISEGQMTRREAFYMTWTTDNLSLLAHLASRCFLPLTHTTYTPSHTFRLLMHICDVPTTCQTLGKMLPGTQSGQNQLLSESDTPDPRRHLEGLVRSLPDWWSSPSALSPG